MHFKRLFCRQKQRKIAGLSIKWLILIDIWNFRNYNQIKSLSFKFQELTILYIKAPSLSDYFDCPYLPERKFRQEYLFAVDVSKEEFNDLLVNGWRRFGYYFFRPKCENCTECTPIRVKVNDFYTGKSQKRIVRKNKNVEIIIKPLEYREEIFNIYKEHSMDRFNQTGNQEDFIESFFYDTVPAFQSEYYLNDELIAFGFFDMSSEALSSVYFVYKTKYKFLSMGTFSAIKEIEYAKSLGLKYYYLGYYIKENHHMSYKNKFKPHDLFNWQNEKWEGI